MRTLTNFSADTKRRPMRPAATPARASLNGQADRPVRCVADCGRLAIWYPSESTTHLPVNAGDDRGDERLAALVRVRICSVNSTPVNGTREDRTPPAGERGGDEVRRSSSREPARQRGSGVGDRAGHLQRSALAPDRCAEQVAGHGATEDHRRHPRGHAVGERVRLLDDRRACRPSPVPPQ